MVSLGPLKRAVESGKRKIVPAYSLRAGVLGFRFSDDFATGEEVLVHFLSPSLRGALAGCGLWGKDGLLSRFCS